MCEGWGGGLQESLKRGKEGLGDVGVKGLSVEGLRGGQVKKVSDEFPLREVWRDRIQDGGRDQSPL